MRLFWIACTLSGALCAQPAWAQFYVDARCEDGRIVVRATGIDVQEDPKRIGFDLYRSAQGTCEPREKITPAMLEDDSGTFSFDFIDETAKPNTSYVYELMGVNENLEPYHLLSFRWGFASCGEAPVALGRIDDRPNTWWIDFTYTCTSWCSKAGALLARIPADLAALLEVNGPMDVVLYGNIVHHEFDGPLMYADRWAPAECAPTSVLDSPWGAIKQLYR